MSGSISFSEQYQRYHGELEFIIKDVNGCVINTIRQANIVKIFAKEILAHRLAHSRVWDPNANTGAGAWVNHNIDIEEFAAKYIIFGASFDDEGNPLDFTDSRYYVADSVAGGFVPRTLGVGAEFDGGLINAVPIAEPQRPLKRIERIYFESSYQPSGTPLLQDDVRAMNNVVVFETTLLKDEYNGFGLSPGDFFTLTEVALVSAEEIESVGACDCDPRDIFLLGNSTGEALLANSSGTSTISLDPSEPDVDLIKEGDQIKIVGVGSTAAAAQTQDQINPFYLVISKMIGGRDIVLDRVPVDSEGNPIVGEVGVFRDGFRILSHRILKSPIKKSESFEIVCRWRIVMN